MVIVYLLLNMGWVVYNLFALVLEHFHPLREAARAQARPPVRGTGGAPALRESLARRRPSTSRRAGATCARSLPKTSSRNTKDHPPALRGHGGQAGRILRYIPGKKSYAVQFLDMESETYARLVQQFTLNRDAGFGVRVQVARAYALYEGLGVLLRGARRPKETIAGYGRKAKGKPAARRRPKRQKRTRKTGRAAQTRRGRI